MSNLIGRNVWEEGERDNFAGGAFRDGHRLGGEPTIRALTVTRQRIMDSRVDPSTTEQASNLVSPGYASDVQVIRTTHPFNRSHQTYGRIVEKPPVFVYG